MPINYFNGIGRLSALNVVLNDISLHTNQMLSQPVDLIKIIISAIYYRSESLIDLFQPQYPDSATKHQETNEKANSPIRNGAIEPSYQYTSNNDA